MELYDGRPDNIEGRLPREIRTYDFLDNLGIEYKRTDHEPANNMEWMYSETWLHEDGFEEKDLADIKAYIRETREHGLILGYKYISHDLVPSFYLADEQTPVCRDIAGSGICKGNSK